MFCMVFYNILIFCILLFYIPHLTLRRKWHKGIWMQCGIFRRKSLPSNKKRPCIWIHAVSVGEVLLIESFVKSFKKRYKEYSIVLSTITVTGNRIAKERLGHSVDVIYAPFDFSWSVQRYVDIIEPSLYIAAETEIWPNLYKEFNKRSVPIIQINGRISDKSFKGYKRIKPFLDKTFKRVDKFCVQSQTDAKRIDYLGGKLDNIKVMGNLKFDNLINIKPLKREYYGLKESDIVLVVGSTHNEEESIFLDLYKELLKEYKELKMILAPRHIERIGDIIRLIEDKDLEFTRLSQMKREKGFDPLLLVDTIGDLGSLYSLGDLVFIGKTLCGYGGQNILEPAFFAKPIIVGPHMENFKESMALFCEHKAIIQIKEREELFSVCRRLLNNDKERINLGLRARDVVNRNIGATEKTLKVIDNYLKE